MPKLGIAVQGVVGLAAINAMAMAMAVIRGEDGKLPGFSRLSEMQRTRTDTQQP